MNSPQRSTGSLAPDGALATAGFAFALLVIAQGIQLTAVVAGGAAYPGYDPVRQHISELGATGAAAGPLVSWVGFVPAGLGIAAFCLIAGWLLRSSRMALTACLLLALSGAGLAGSGVFPCAFECSHTPLTGGALAHDVVTGVGYVGGLVGMAVAAVWARSTSARWLAPLGAACVILSAAGMVALVAEIEFAGLLQRVMEAAFAVFLLAFGWALSRGRLPLTPVAA